MQRHPHWWYYSHSNLQVQNQSQQISHGKIKSDAAGNFKITFVAKPDPEITSENDPIFTYSIHADVISPDGETRSGEAAIRVGYTALDVNVTTDKDLYNNKGFPLIIATQTLDGNYLPRTVQIEIYRLKEPNNPIRENLLNKRGRNDGIASGEGEFGEDWTTWPKDTIVYKANTNTEHTNPDTTFIKLPCGLYKAECLSKDLFGKEVKALLPLLVLSDWDSKKFSIKLPFIAKVKNESVEVGEALQALWGTGYQSGRCYIEIEHDNKILKKYWTDENCTQHSFTFPITEELRGGISVRFTQVRE